MNLRTAFTFALIAMLGSMIHAQEPVALHPDSGKEQAALDADIAKLNAGILRSAEALNHAAAVLTREHNVIWSLPDDRLIALLNADVKRTLAIAAAKDKAAVEINSMLNQLNISRYTNRAPVGFGREDVKYDEATSKFVIIPAEEPAE